MPRLWAAGLLLRRIRPDAGMILLLFALVAATSFLFAAAPRLLNRAFDDALRHEMVAAPAVQRNLAFAMAGQISPGSDGGVAAVRSYTDDLETQLPPTLRGLIAQRSLIVSSIRFNVRNPPVAETHLTLRYQDGLPAATHLVAGRWPSAATVLLPRSDATDFGAPVSNNPAAPITLEAALSKAEATDTGIQLGDRMEVTVDGSDPMLRGGAPFDLVPLDIQIVGFYQPNDPKAETWSGDADLIRTQQTGSPESPVYYLTAFVAPGTYPSLWNSGMPFRYEWRLRIDPARVDAGKLAQLQSDIRGLNIATGATELGSPGTVVLRTGLLEILDSFAAEAAQATSVLSVAAIGPFGLAGAALGMIAILLVMRRRSALTLARGRGASGSLLIGTQLWEAALVAGAGSLVGLLAAVALIPARENPLSLILALAVGVVGILVLVAASWPGARRPLGQLERDDPPVLRVSPRRLVIELTIVLIALAAVALIRQRGLTVDGGGANARFDPLLAAAPVLGGVAAGIVATRLYPLPIRALGWLAARRRDLVPVLGLRTIGRHPAAANLPLMVLMLTAAFGAFASVVVSSIDQGQVVASYRGVGADYRLDHVGLGPLPDLDLAAIPDIQASATGVDDRSAVLTTRPDERAAFQVEAIDAIAYQQVVAGSPVDPQWPSAFSAAPPVGSVGTPKQPIPAILSWTLPQGSASLKIGDLFQVTLKDKPLTVRLVERRGDFAGMDAEGPFALVPYRWVQQALGTQTPLPTVMWLRGGKGVAGPLAAAITKSGGTVHVLSRHNAADALADQPLGTTIVNAYAVALLAAAIYLALTVIGALILSAARRTQDLAYLRVLGISGRQALGLTVVENAPPVLVALAPGVALGIGIAYVVEPGLGLVTFVGASDVPLFVDLRALGLMVVALIAVFALAVAAGTWLVRRERLVYALRVGED
jgi:putative ABC transport system permease protein